MHRDTLYTDCRVATLQYGKNNYGLIDDAAIVVVNGRIAWVGDVQTVPEQYSGLTSVVLGRRLVTPALIDCHTHLVFAGNRAREFEMRLNGASYQEISESGGGIVSTVKATRAASDNQLIQDAVNRLDDLIDEGVAVVEIKSGYGLTVADELRMLRVARKLESMRPVKIVTTMLAAHAIPPEYRDRSDDYIDEVAIPSLRQAHEEGLVDAVDGFCETIAFSNTQIERIFSVAQSLGLPVKLHAEQLSDQKGALLVAKYKGLSADHLEFICVNDVEDFAKSGAVAVMLPGAFYTLGETQRPPIEHFRKAGVEMAVATDCNPGSSPISSLLSCMNMACTQFSMTPEEAFAGTTRCAAKALGLTREYGTIESEKKAELAVWDVQHPAELVYWVGPSKLHKRISYWGQE